MEMPQPTEQHRKLEKLVGNWIGSEQIHPSPWDPQGGPAVGRVENRLALDGFAVIQDYTQERNGAVSFTGHGIFSWDSMQQRYFMHWWDSMGSPVNAFVGDFDGEVLSMTYQSPQGYHRVSIDLSQENGYTFKMDVSGDGNEWQTFMTGEYERQS